jgi:hypothetical protein
MIAGLNPENNGHTDLRSVTRDRPCPVCDGDHKCSVGADGLILCGRRDGPVPGFRHLGPAQPDPQWHLFRRDDDPAARSGVASRPAQGAADWSARARRFAKNVTPQLRDELADLLGLPAGCLDTLPLLGYSPDDRGGCWTFPEADARGVVIGLNRRWRSSDKKVISGGKRGLTLPEGWRDRPGPVLLVEGASDTLALTACGLAVIGRPSNTGGVALLAKLLQDCPADRPILVVGENDAKSDGSWPGRDGAERTAAALAERLKRPVAWALPPDGAKDVRAWLLARAAEDGDWPDRGRRLLDGLRAAETIIRPVTAAKPKPSAIAPPAGAAYYVEGNVTYRRQHTRDGEPMAG